MQTTHKGCSGNQRYIHTVNIHMGLPIQNTRAEIIWLMLYFLISFWKVGSRKVRGKKEPDKPWFQETINIKGTTKKLGGLQTGYQNVMFCSKRKRHVYLSPL